MPSWRVIAWGGEHDAPVNIIASAWALPHEPVHVTAKAPAGLAYIAAVSPFGAFVVRYRGVGGEASAWRGPANSNWPSRC